MLHALVHPVSPRIADCELTFLAPSTLDFGRATAQHRAYCAALERLGVAVSQLSGNEAYADSCFIEDTAVVLDDVAVICSPGAPSRRGETAVVEQALAGRRELARISLPATLEGGDVLKLRRTLLVGLSTRTNAAGIAALAQVVIPLGYRLTPVPTSGSLHLKTACTAIDDETLFVNPAWVDVEALRGFRIVDTPPDEPWSANLLRVGETVCLPAGFPRAAELLAGRVVQMETIEISELRKAEAGLTCLSLLFEESVAFHPDVQPRG